MPGGRVLTIVCLLGAAGCAGAGAPAAPTTATPGTQACLFTPAANPPMFDAVGGAASVAVATAPGCRYRIEPASPADAWIGAEAGGVMDGPASVRVIAAPNRSFTARIGTLIVRHENGDVLASYSVSQRGAGCLYSVSPEVENLTWMGTYDGAGDSPLRVSVHAEPAACMWTATPSVPWIRLYSSSGTGDGAIYISLVNWNTTPSARKGTVVVAGLSGVNPDASVQVIQQGR